MKSIRWLVAFLLLSQASLFASINGRVVNQTTGKPQQGVSILLVKPGQSGMKTIGSTVTDASGQFLFAKDEPGGGPQLLQASYKGVNYNKLMTPNIPTSNVELQVYEATKSAAVAHVIQHMVIFEPNSAQIAVNETVVIQNDSTTTYKNDDLGGLRFYLPPSANGQVKVSAQGPQGMPLPEAAERTSESDVLKVNFPVKPGETQFQLTYVLPSGTPFKFRSRVVGVKGMVEGPVRLIAPAGVTLAGNDIQALGTEPKTQATIYNVNAPDMFSVDISGTGSLHTDDTGAGGQDSDSPQVTQANPPIYKHLPWLVALAFSVLGVGMAILFQNSPARSRS